MNLTDLAMGITAHLLIGSITGLALNPWALLGSAIASVAVGNWMRQDSSPQDCQLPIIVHPLG